MTAREAPSCGSGPVARPVIFTPIAQRPSGMTCARRLAGARKPAPSTGSPSRPEPRSGRRRARLSFLLPVLALLLGALSPFAAAPAAADVLLSNIERPHGSAVIFWDGSAVGQRFTTGPHAGGYTLTSIDTVAVVAFNQLETMKAELWSSVAIPNQNPPEYHPGTKLADLTVPSAIPVGTVSFAAPPGTILEPNTGYIFLFGSTAARDFQAEEGDLSLTASTGVDSAAPGWSLFKQRVTRDAGATTYDNASAYRMRIRVNGAAFTPPTAVEVTTVSPSMTRAGIWKQSDLPDPVGITVSACRPPRSASITASWPGRNPSKPKTSRSALRAASSEPPPVPGSREASPNDESGGRLDDPGGSLPSSASGRRYALSIRRGPGSGAARRPRRAALQSAFRRPFAASPGQSNPDLRHRPVDQEFPYPRSGES